MKKVLSQQNIRIIKINKCKSLSGKSILEYQIGCHGDSDTFVRITNNSGGGWFSGEWVYLKNLIAALESTTQLLTSYAFQALFKGKSDNTAAFLFAALKEEGLVSTDTENPRCYVLQSVDSFMQSLKALITSGVSLKDTSVKASKASTQNTDDDIPVLSSKPKLESGKAITQAHKL
ncbi:MAG TPA: hypothetical protein PLW03_05785 [Methylotenera sp.]|nr:hypothetical protein [Methylotenera sp.]